MLFLAIPDKIYIPMPYVYLVVGVIAAVILALSLKNKAAKAAAEKAAADKKAAEPVAVAEDVPASEGPLAPGSAGKLKLYDTPPKTAAMVMAIVADRLQKPINELRFISIKEVK